MNHIGSMRLLDVAQDQINKRPFSLTSLEEEHLLECIECQESLADFFTTVDTALDNKIDDSSKNGFAR